VGQHNVYDGERVHVRRRRCSTCIFGPRSPVDAERVAGMVAECAGEGVIPCHHHLDLEVNPVCRGYFDLGENMSLRLAAALEVIEWHDEDPWVVDDPVDDDATVARDDATGET
jgi:hypothetical protein